ncbi:MAG TPA: hypothetical protein VN840_20860 [Streptosporangiaceae bacterium]|nr:hypothetical protein [Streptosporangiaceae bacterium]
MPLERLLRLAGHRRRSCPAWWPYHSELPMWEVRIGADGRYDATLAGAGARLSVHGGDPGELRDHIRQTVLTALL